MDPHTFGYDATNDPLVVLGFVLSTTILMLPLAIAMVCEVTWRCGLCGKLNSTNFLKFLLLWCDHTPDTH